MNTITCPACLKDFDPLKTPAMPFCSDRCRLVDLGRWYDEENSLPLSPEEKAELELKRLLDQRAGGQEKDMNGFA